MVLTYSLLIIDTNTDFLIVQTPYCHKCLKTKLGVNVLSNHELSKKEVSSCKKEFDIRIIRIKCECQSNLENKIEELDASDNVSIQVSRY